jgi:hypothetical protein
MEMTNYRPRHFKSIRHAAIYQTVNSTLKFKSPDRHPLPPPLFTTTIKTYESYYEFDMLVKFFKFRTDREKLFLSFLIFIYAMIKILQKVEWKERRIAEVSMDE